MSASASALAAAVLALHAAVIAFNLFGLVAIPLGARLGWAFVRVFWWRALHLGSMATVAVQAAAGRACFLTIWQDGLEGQAGGEPLVARLVNRLIYWPLPLWVFAAAYGLALAYVLLLWRLVPPRRARSPK
jgi:hypothetical protein